MLLPVTTDTIVAIASGPTPARVGLVRLSGPAAFELLVRAGAAVAAPRGTGWTSERLLCGRHAVPATVFWYPAPRSYTGQDVAEVHLPGSAPLLRVFCEQLHIWGARPALPGEFTGRAYLAGKLDADQVEGVLSLMQATTEAGARQAARRLQTRVQSALERMIGCLTDLVARIEAGIDFVDEEDVRFISTVEIEAALERLARDLAELMIAQSQVRRAAWPHVALAGRPNAGKSTLFNALLGRERALVSPIAGTTRDVLTAEVEIQGARLALQDAAGLSGDADALAVAADQAAHVARGNADVAVWVHPADSPWTAGDAASCAAVPPERLLIVRSKADLPRAWGSAPSGLPRALDVCGLTGAGLDALRSALVERLSALPAPAAGGGEGEGLAGAGEALRRAQVLVSRAAAEPELVALELRTTWELLRCAEARPLDEQILDRVMTQFCVGK